MANNGEQQRQPDTPFDLTILYMEDARSWCEYLFDIFQPYEVYQNSEEITTFPTHEMTLNNIKESRVVIVIVSPVFIDNCSPMLEQYADQVVALLCGVEEDDLENILPTVPSSKQWKVVEALSGSRNITQVTLKMLDGVDSDGADSDTGPDYLIMHGNLITDHDPEDTYLTMHGNVADIKEDDDTYLTMQGNVTDEVGGDYITMIGGKIEEGNEDLYETMVGNSQEPEDNYQVMTGTSKGSSWPPKVASHEFAYKEQGNIQYSEDVYISPASFRIGSKEPLFIFFTKQVVSTRPEDIYKVLFKCNSRTTNVMAVVVNVCTLRINYLPEGLVVVEVLHNSQSIAVLELKVFGSMGLIAELLQTITNPLEFMCQALHISPADSNTLDNVLFEHCQRHCPQDGFSKVFLTNQQTPTESTTSNEVPTVLHFAARYGLKNMCSMLSNCPGAYQAMSTTNCNGDTPSALAAKSGYQDLKEFLENYMFYNSSPSSQQTQEYAENNNTQHPEEMGTFDPSYVHMTGDLRNQSPQYINKVGGLKSDYDRPFPVAIPAKPLLLRDDTIKSLVSGSQDDIYDFYDNKSWNFQRQGDNDDDEDEENAADYEKLGDQPEQPLPRRPPQGLPGSDEPVVRGNVSIIPNEELENVPRTNNPDAEIPESQQALIDLQNKVKNNEISVEAAVSQFKELEMGRRRDQFSFKTQSAALSQINQQTSPKKIKKFGGFFKKKDIINPIKPPPKVPLIQPAFKSHPPVSPMLQPPAVSPKVAGTTTKKYKAIGPPPSPKPKPQPPGSPNSVRKVSSKSVGIYDKTSGRQLPDRFVEGGQSPVTSPKQGRVTDRYTTSEDMLTNRPISSLSAGSRSSTLSTCSRDSSYGSEPDPDRVADPPQPPERRSPDRKHPKTKRLSGKFSTEYRDKPLPPIPFRAKVSEPARSRVQMGTEHSTPLAGCPRRSPPLPPPSLSRDSVLRPGDTQTLPPAAPTKPKPQPRPRMSKIQQQ